MFSVPQSSLSSKSRMTSSERSRRMMDSLTSSFSMPVAATSCLMVARSMPSIMFSTLRSVSVTSSCLSAA